MLNTVAPIKFQCNESCIITGDIFTSNADVLVNPVNCVGIMGAGLAKQFKQRFPEIFEPYKMVCDSHKLDPGDYFLYSGDGFRVLNFATKNHWKHPSKLDWIEAGLNRLVKEKWAQDLSFAFPLLGAGYGGIPDNVSRDAIVRVLKKAPFKWELYIYA